MTKLKQKFLKFISVCFIILISGLMGKFVLWFIWLLIYSIGFELISDVMHYKMSYDIQMYGFICGAVSGGIFILIFNSWVTVATALFLQQFVSSCLALILIAGGWYIGVVTYYLANAAVVILGIIYRRRINKIVLP